MKNKKYTDVFKHMKNKQNIKFICSSRGEGKRYIDPETIFMLSDGTKLKTIWMTKFYVERIYKYVANETYYEVVRSYLDSNNIRTIILKQIY